MEEDMFCELEEFKKAIEKCLTLISDESLAQRGLKREDLNNILDKLEALRKFLLWLKDEAEREKNYYNLVRNLEEKNFSREYKIFIGFLGKLLDAAQIVKDSTFRNKQVKDYIRKSLERTGHDFILEEINDSLKNNLFQELIDAVAAFTLLEVVYSFSEDRRNPISTLRHNMGNRLPEEYFSELLAGWLVEEVILLHLTNKKIVVDKSGIDRERKILFRKAEAMGTYDLNIIFGNRFGLEIQRVGKIEIKKKKNILKTYLKEHKWKQLKENNSILLLWLGKGKIELKENEIVKSSGDSPSYLLFLTKDDPLEYHKNYLEIPKDLLKIKAIKWSEFKEIPKEELIKKIMVE